LCCVASQHYRVAYSAPHIHPASSCSQRWWGVLSLSSTLVGPSLSSPVRTSLPPYEQLLVAEGSGAMGVVVSPLSLSSSCPALAVLVLVPLVLVSSSSLSPPLPPLPLLARHRRGDGDRPVSTRSTLRARAGSGGGRVLGCRLIHLVFMRVALYSSCTHDPPYEQLLVGMGWVPLSSFHPRSIPRAVAREAGMGGAAVASSSAGCTRNPPYEQLLVRLEASAGSIFHVEGGCYLSVTWHRGGVGWCLPDGCPPSRVSQRPSLIS
jgi:hypothetical protein